MKKYFTLLLIMTLAMFLPTTKAQQYQLLNNGFEEWDNNSVPVNWHTFNTADGSYSSMASSNHHYKRSGQRTGGSGSYFLEIYTKSILGIKANGNMTTGRIHAGAMSATSDNNYNYTDIDGGYKQEFTATPDSMYFWVSFYASSASEYASVRVHIHGNSEFIDGRYGTDGSDVNTPSKYNRKAVSEFTRTTSSSSSYVWVQKKVPFVKGTGSANYVLFTLSTNKTGGAGAANDALAIDDIEFIYSAWATDIVYNNQSIEEFSKTTYDYVRTVEYVSELASISELNFNVATEVEDVTKEIVITETTYNGRPAKLATITITAEDGVTVKEYRVTVYALNDDPVSYNVTATANPTAGGSVALSPNDGTYLSGTSVTMTATANTGYDFVQWNDGVTTNPRTITVTEDASYVAQFALQTYTVSVEASPAAGGTVTGGGTYSYNDAAILTATANTGYEFVRWNDGNTENPRTVNVTADVTYTAIFEVPSYTVTATANNALWGTVSGSGSYNYGETATVEATAATDYHFVRWSNNETENPYSFTVTANTTITAYFEMDEITYYDVTVASANTQMGTASGTATVREGYTTVITATPNTGYHFTQWNDGNSENPRTVTVTANVTYTASFAPNTYTITALSGNATMGSVAGGGEYAYGSTATLTATAEEGYRFVEWNDGNTENPREVSVSGDATYTATFERISYTVNAMSNNEVYGTVAGGGSYYYGETATLTATAEEGYHFARWSDNTTDNPYSFEVYENKNITAMFEEDGVIVNYYTVSGVAANATMGTVTGSGEYQENSTATLTAVANYGYEFVEWNDGNTDNPRTFTVTEDVTYTATFQPKTYVLTVVANPTEGGAVTGSGTYTYGQTVVISATPNAGYAFTTWNDGNMTATRNVTVSGNATYTANFEQEVYNINITVNNAAYGSATGSGTYHYGETVTATATANEGYQFVQWNNGETVNPYTFEATESMTLVAQFGAQSVSYYTVVANADNNAHGQVTGSGVYTSESVATLTAIPAAGYRFESWQDGVTTNPRSIVVTQDTNFTATFAEETYTVTLSVNDASMGTVAGEGIYSYMQQVTVTATANEGYHFVAWDNGVAQQTYTFPITSNVELTAVFEEDEIEMYTITVLSADENRGQAYGSGEYEAGATVEISAVGAPNYAFMRWQDGNSDNPRTIVVTGNATYTAYFQFDAAIFEAPSARVIAWAEGKKLHVKGVENHSVIVTDMMGRVIYKADQCQFDTFEIIVPNFGVYLVHADGAATRKVMVGR